MKNRFRDLHLKHVNERLRSLKEQDLVMRPTQGWIKFIREALGMSSKALAQKLQIKAPTLSETEKRELDESITLKNLRKTAEAMNCDLVYYFLPRQEIKKMIEERARYVASQKFRDIQNHMDLENQAVSEEYLKMQIDSMVTKLIESKKLWDDEK
jgi:predicted DNA-binding mobile mystery protein A